MGSLEVGVSKAYFTYLQPPVSYAMQSRVSVCDVEVFPRRIDYQLTASRGCSDSEIGMEEIPAGLHCTLEIRWKQ